MAFLRLQQYEEEGLLAVLCDGMGGMAEGGMIAAQTVFGDAENIPVGRDRRGARIGSASAEPRGLQAVSGPRRYNVGGRPAIKDGALRFWCVGDSDLFLLMEKAKRCMH